MGVLLLLVPAAAALLLLPVKGRKPLHAISLSAAVLMAAAAAWLTAEVLRGGSVSYAAAGGLFYVDALSVIVLDIVAAIGLMTGIYSIGYLEAEVRHGKISEGKLKFYYVLTNAFLFTMMLALTVRNMGVMWIAIEATTLASAFLVGFYNDRNAIEAAWKYIILCSVGIALAMLGIIFLHLSSTDVLETRQMLDFTVLMDRAKELRTPTVRLAFLFILVGFGTKAGLAPMHTWLPDAHSQAPSPISALLSGVLLNSAMYAIIRTVSIVNRNLGDSRFAGRLMIGFGLLSILAAAVFILTQKDYKRLLAYSSIEHMGIIAVAVGLFTPLSVFGALFHMINHSLTKSMLFLTSGGILHKYDTKLIHRVRGVFKLLPVTGAVFFLGLLAIAGTPPFSVFSSEFGILASIFKEHRFLLGSVLAVLLAVVFAGIALNLFRMFFGPPGPDRKPGEANLPGVAVTLVLLAVIAVSGLLMPDRLLALLTQARDIVIGGVMIMEMQDRIHQLKTAFPEDILSVETANGNEIRMDARPSGMPDIARLVSGTLGFPLVSLFANDERGLTGDFAVYYVFADAACGTLLVFRIPVAPDSADFPSISATVHAAGLYEREIQDLFGLRPIGHPDAKRLVFHGNWPLGSYPLRKEFDGTKRPENAGLKPVFQHVTGEGVFEIPVGPVHAGIIEPGHFRFSVAGEPVINLEAQLYFVHKGIEKLCEGQGIERCLYISERISGDETFANSLAYCLAIEKIAGVQIPARADHTRLVFAELERLTSHLGDLAGVCLDTGYGFATNQFRMIRGWAYLLADEFCGMRFLRSVNRPGGVRKDFLAGKEDSAIGQLRKIRAELVDTADIVRSNSLFMDRTENTGILRLETALDLHAVGPPARASGIRCDVRKDFPYGAYAKMDFTVPEYRNGDVNSRIDTKIEEALTSIDLLSAALASMPAGEVFDPLPGLTPYRSAFGMTEAPRGENVHWVMTGEGDTVFRYKIRTPSFCNWPALTHAVKGNIVPDFPLINKSFNLSYAGNDL